MDRELSQLSIDDMFSGDIGGKANLSKSSDSSAKESSTPVLQGARQNSSRINARVDTSTLAPMLKHYLEVKQQYQDKALLFQVGDFYEVFFEDAEKVSEVLGIRLTSRHKDQPNPIPMCGVPIHALDNYLPKLLDDGISCVIVSQVEQASNTKGMVKREISRIVTPGVRYEGDGLEQFEYNYLASVCFSQRGDGAVSYVDVSTGKLVVQEAETIEGLIEIIQRVKPVELICPSELFSRPISKTDSAYQLFRQTASELSCQIIRRPFVKVSDVELTKTLQKLFHDSEGLQSLIVNNNLLLDELGRSAIAGVIAYVDEISFGRMPKFSKYSVTGAASDVFIDAATRRNLEISEARIDGSKKNSLFSHINYAKTAMGSRLLLDWLLSPITNVKQINERLNSVEWLTLNSDTLIRIRALLVGIRDIDRLLSRISSNRITPYDLKSLADSLLCLPELETLVKSCDCGLLFEIAEKFDSLTDIAKELSEALSDEAPTKVTEGGIIRPGYNSEVDRLRGIKTNAHRLLSELESRERERTGINSLRIKYNSVFGYFIEVSKANLSRVPDNFERKQTLVNAERFVTEELKNHEVEILSAKSRQIDLERELFVELKNKIVTAASRIQLASSSLAVIDALCSFAYLAREHNYSKPEFSETDQMLIEQGRHPVIERVIGQHNFVSNDSKLDTDYRRFAILTGPNMGGKSTYLRQVGLIQLLAQAGSFVPAKRAQLSIVDRIFTRIGTSDDLARGDSTFMVEMREVATIVRKATSKSLVLIDEVGRGTATADGFSIATAIAEWLHDTVKCKTIFATHFHELTELTASKEGMFCLAVGIIEKEHNIVFTHKIMEEISDRSYGIEVAKLAGLPIELIDRARDLLDSTSREVVLKPDFNIPKKVNDLEAKPVVDFSKIQKELSEIDPNSLSPYQALGELIRLKELTKFNQK